VPRGQPNEILRIDGRGGAPDVTVSGPGGLRLSSNGRALATQPRLIIARDAARQRTDVVILHPRAGIYRVRAAAGAVPVARVSAAHGFTPRIRARVTGRGATRRLRYRVNAEPGEKVTFIERGGGVDRLIGTTSHARGTLRFRPAPGAAGVRQIVASGTAGGVPLVLRAGVADGGHETVASYRAPGPRRLGRVSHVLAYRTGTRLHVSFHAARGAQRYAVMVALGNGLRTQYEIRARRLSKVLANPAAPLTGKVSVMALGDGLRTTDGRVVKVKLLAAKPESRKRAARTRH
jgi:hypothetical protein